MGASTSLALNSSGRPSISYYDGTNKHLKYISYNGTTWSAQTVDSADNVGQYTSLALNSSGLPSISYYDLANKDLKYTYFDGTSWITTTVDGPDSVGQYTSLALDSYGHPPSATTTLPTWTSSTPPSPSRARFPSSPSAASAPSADSSSAAAPRPLASSQPLFFLLLPGQESPRGENLDSYIKAADLAVVVLFKTFDSDEQGAAFWKAWEQQFPK